MVILGDLAAPGGEHICTLEKTFQRNLHLFKGKTIICNFEGLIVDGGNLNSSEPLLFNNGKVADLLTENGPAVTCLANNHTLDFPGQFDRTISYFEDRKLIFAGAGKSRQGAEQPIRFNDGSKEIILYNACWDFLLYNHSNPSNGIYIAEINEGNLISDVAVQRKLNPDSRIVLYFHWNFDLETLPFPMHRRFAKSLIDAGADLVVGSHSHCVQGGEQYKEGHIIYGLGNFYLPHGVFAGGKISYPDFADTELVLEWDSTTNEAVCHWYEYRFDGKMDNLMYLGQESFGDSKRLMEYSPYQGMNDEEYYKYFKMNRRKKKLIPVFKDFNAYNRNRFYTWLLKRRARMARFLAKHHVIRWQN